MNQKPVYLFTGFLESGKTTFIKNKIKDSDFVCGKNVLLLVCEDGFEEYDCEYKNVIIEFILSEDKLSKDYLRSLDVKYNVDKILIEYHGMWKLESLYKCLPVNWLIYQQINFINSKTFTNYNLMFRELMVEKIKDSEICVFNYYKDTYDKQLFHKTIRVITKKNCIYYKYLDNTVEKDEIIDPLPYDITSDVINIEFKDYAVFYQEIVEYPEKYNHKAINIDVKCCMDLQNRISVGRKVMVCCEADIKFLGILIGNQNQLHLNKWYNITGVLIFSNNEFYIDVGDFKTIEEPDINYQVATFY